MTWSMRTKRYLGGAAAFAAITGLLGRPRRCADVVVDDAKAAVAAICRPADHMGRPDRGAEAGGRQEDRLPVGRRAERHLASLRRLHQGGRREDRLEGDDHRRQGQPDLVARRHEPGDRAEAGRHRPLRRRREPARTRSRPASRRGSSSSACTPPACPGRSPTSISSSTSRRIRARSARPRPTGRSPIRTARRSVVVLSHNEYAIAEVKSMATKDEIEKCPRLQGARIRQLAGLGSGAAPAAADHELGAALRPAALRHLGRRQRLGLRRAGAALAAASIPTRSS